MKRILFVLLFAVLGQCLLAQSYTISSLRKLIKVNPTQIVGGDTLRTAITNIGFNDAVQKFTTLSAIGAGNNIQISKMSLAYDAPPHAGKFGTKSGQTITLGNNLGHYVGGAWTADTIMTVSDVAKGDFVYRQGVLFMGYVTAKTSTTVTVAGGIAFNGSTWFTFEKSPLNTPDIGKFDFSLLNENGALASDVVKTRYVFKNTHGTKVDNAMLAAYNSAAGLSQSLAFSQNYTGVADTAVAPSITSDSIALNIASTIGGYNSSTGYTPAYFRIEHKYPGGCFNTFAGSENRVRLFASFVNGSTAPWQTYGHVAGYGQRLINCTIPGSPPTNTNGFLTALNSTAYLDWTNVNSASDNIACTIKKILGAALTPPPVVREGTCSNNLNTTMSSSSCFGELLVADPIFDSELPLSVVRLNPTQTSFLDGDSIKWVATDLVGNSASCVSLVNVIDLTLPEISTNNITLQAGASLGQSSIVFSDNCSVSSVTNNAPSQLQLGENQVLWSVTDAQGNTSAAWQTVLVEDTIAPELICVNDYSVEISLDFFPNPISPTVFDNAGAENVNLQVVMPFNMTLGPNEISWIATDQSGNQSTCSYVLTLTDTTAPLIDCPASISIDSSMSSTYFPSGASVSDNYTTPVDVSYVYSPLSIGTNMVTVIATDSQGNTSSCEYSIMVTGTSDILTLRTNDFGVYPNPFRDELNLTERTPVKLYNLMGSLIYAGFTNKIDTSNLSSGVYFINAKGVTKKVVKE